MISIHLDGEDEQLLLELLVFEGKGSYSSIISKALRALKKRKYAVPLNLDPTQVPGFHEIDDLPGEIWKVVSGYTDYEVSNCGRVRSNKGGFKRLRRQSNLAKDSNYKRVSLTRNKSRWQPLVQQLVASAFLSNEEGKDNVNHKDGNKANNTLSNLEWTTRSENNAHSSLTGLHSRGERHHKSKLTEQDVKNIRQASASGRSALDLASEYCVSITTVINAINRKSWSHLD